MDGLNFSIRARARNRHEPRAIKQLVCSKEIKRSKGSQLTVFTYLQLRHLSDSRRLHDKSLALVSQSTSSPPLQHHECQHVRMPIYRSPILTRSEFTSMRSEMLRRLQISGSLHPRMQEPPNRPNRRYFDFE